MTSALFKDFNERSKEVSKYFIFLKSLEQGTTKLSMEGKDKIIKIRKIDSELQNTLKASGFLLIYNLTESTMQNAIEVIFDKLISNGVSFDDIKPELKKVILKNLKKRNTDKVLSTITNISLDIIAAGFDFENDKIFSGNIDGKVIKDIAKEYGFSPKTNPIKTEDGKTLVIVKTNRNDLAHGIKSFEEVGELYDTDRLIEIKNQVIRYLREILQNIETYLINKDYLA